MRFRPMGLSDVLFLFFSSITKLIHFGSQAIKKNIFSRALCMTKCFTCILVFFITIVMKSSLPVPNCSERSQLLVCTLCILRIGNQSSFYLSTVPLLEVCQTLTIKWYLYLSVNHVLNCQTLPNKLYLGRIIAFHNVFMLGQYSNLIFIEYFLQGNLQKCDARNFFSSIYSIIFRIVDAQWFWC